MQMDACTVVVYLIYSVHVTDGQSLKVFYCHQASPVLLEIQNIVIISILNIVTIPIQNIVTIPILNIVTIPIQSIVTIPIHNIVILSCHLPNPGWHYCFNPQCCYHLHP